MLQAHSLCGEQTDKPVTRKKNCGSKTGLLTYETVKTKKTSSSLSSSSSSGSTLSKTMPDYNEHLHKKQQSDHVGSSLPPISSLVCRNEENTAHTMSARGSQAPETRLCDRSFCVRQRVRLLPDLPQARDARHHNSANTSGQLVAFYREEQAAAREVLKVARDLFYDVTVHCTSIIVGDVYDQMRLLALKAAVSCFLLEEIVKALPRHSILAPCVGLLLRTLYVPDVQEMRNILGGTVEYPLVLKNLPFDSTAYMLLTNYARKTYFIAHHELTQKVIYQAHVNRTRMRHFSRLPRIFALLNSKWIKSILRTVLKGWQHMCRTRRQGEQKHRARWARRFEGERIRSVLLSWRLYASVRLQSAAAEESFNERIRSLVENTRRLESEITHFSEENVKVGDELNVKEEQCAALEKQILETEVIYKSKLEKVREMDFVGCRLLDSLLTKTPFPSDTQSLSPLEVLVFWANTTLVESPFGILILGSSDENFARNIEDLDTKPRKGQQELVSVNMSDMHEDDFPFNRLLMETATAHVPMHYFMALMRALDDDAGPNNEDMKTVCLADKQVRFLRSQIENKASAEPLNVDMASLLEDEATVGRKITEAYKSLTGHPCIVTAEQLMTRNCGVQLVFLASLMRYFANWMESCVKKQRPFYDSRLSLTTSSDKAIGELPLDTCFGMRDQKFYEWSHPPQNHIKWSARVENQRQWIAASFSAMHEAMKMATKTQTFIIPLWSQDNTAEFMENVTLRRLSDILPKESVTSNSFFLRLARSVENFIPKIRTLFMLYAQKKSSANNGAGDKSTSDIGSFYITSIDIWRLLRDCNVVCGPGKPDRFAVRRIFVKVFEGSAAQASASKAFHKSRSNTSVFSPWPQSQRIAADVELKSSHYKLQFSAAEFVEVLLRCAHMWDGTWQQIQKESGSTVGTNYPPSVSANTATTSATDEGGRSDVKSQQGGNLIRYDAYDVTWGLRLAAVKNFFCDFILPRGLRGPTIDPFRRAMRHPAVRKRLWTNFDNLFSLFARYAKPNEAYGRRTIMQDSGTTMRRLVLEQESNSNSAVLEGNDADTTNYSIAPCENVSIVRVLTLQGAQNMAVDFAWFSISRVTARTIQHLFTAVVVDKEHEPGFVFFPEWLEMLCAMALYYRPDPTKPLHEKIGPFLDQYVLRFYFEDF